MAQIVVRKLEEGVKTRLQRRARRNGRSMEEEVREILRAAASEKISPATSGCKARLLENGEPDSRRSSRSFLRK